MYKVTKTYCHNLGLSASFRQWRAKSHCRFIHGYALEVRLTIVATELDENNWVFDFGGLKDIKRQLIDLFDHKTLVAEDDPKKAMFKELEIAGLIQYVEVPNVGCEGFAKYIYDLAYPRIKELRTNNAELESVEVREHQGNSAIYKGEK